MEILKKSDEISANKKTVVIPFGLKYIPMKKLAIINFEKKPDKVYIGLEMQYFDGDLYGKGYRIIAYRCDGYVDVYDDISLNYIEEETFDVTGKGLCERKRVVIENPVFQIKDGCLLVSFKFIDKNGRTITAKITEHSTQKTKGLNLLAPIGSSTENPSYLPLFFLYDFDFVRKHNTYTELIIDGKIIKQDSFPIPVPKDFQRRYYSRYTLDCQIIEFASAKSCILNEYIPDASGFVAHGLVKYQYSKGKLQKIILEHPNHPIYIDFGLGFPDVRNLDDHKEYVDVFKINAGVDMGSLSGKYSVKKEDDTAKIQLIPTGGWSPVPNSLLTKIMFSKKSVFCNWPKTYRYTQNINIGNLYSVSNWERIN